MKTTLTTLPLAYIQGKLMTLPGDSVFAETIRANAVTDLKGCIKMVKDQARDARELLATVIGEDLLQHIEKL